ncbi:MAG: septal ring lytic transglycosylase RlpA family protein [Alphaproteobacteria bacterium]|nr:septal ring lytic transglycosylase RlpA family protein [Alphaproteobacteria bacterium]
MKKVISLAVLTVLVAGCMNNNSSTPTTYGYDGFSEEKLILSSEEPVTTNTLNDAYLLEAAPKYYIGSTYKIEDVQYVPAEDMTYNQTGIAGIIPTELNGKKTSNGETFDSEKMFATSKTLPLPTIARVTNLDNGKSVVVRINNRGPFVNTRIMDLSAAAANQIDMTSTSKIQIQVLADQSLAVKNATLGTPDQTDTTPQTTVSSGDYSIQVAAVYSEDNANALASKLSKYGTTKVVNEGDMYKVRIIDLDATGAHNVIESLRSAEGMNPGLLKAGKWVNADSI